MTTGKIEYAPDYKSKSPSLPKDFGVMKIVCADGEHRFLPDAPRCGCSETSNPAVELSRLERAVLEAAKEEYRMEYTADHGSNTSTRAEALIKMQRAMKVKREAVAALLSFEAEQK